MTPLQRAALIIRLRPGDVLLFNRSSVYNLAIRIKTWSRVSHCEVVLDGLSVVASRNGKGVNVYDFDFDGLDTVLRPKESFNVEAAWEWFDHEAKGQGYDYLGLLAFFTARLQGKENGRMFCSEFATRYLRAGGLKLFNDYDADGIAPGEFLKSDAFKRVVIPDKRSGMQ